jgi:outer membrane protein assembly factor BamD
MHKKILLVLALVMLMGACRSKYQRALKTNDAAKKLELAQYYYNKKDYYRASTLFEQLQDSYNGTSMAEKVMYYSAYCNYGLSMFALAGYQFKTYFESFPTGQWAEECLYMTAYCQFLESQPYYLDQTDTYKALEAIKLFINVYPDSKYVSDCNVLMDKLRGKLMQKAYRTAKMYYYIGEYKSAIVALQNVVKEFPEISQKEELDYLTVKSYYLLAENSVEEKKEKRMKEALDMHQDFTNEYSNSKYLKDLNKSKYKTELVLSKIKEKKKTESN